MTGSDQLASPGHKYRLYPWISNLGKKDETYAITFVEFDDTSSVEATTFAGAKQLISIGPVASQEAIKELGTNGGSLFNANTAYPYDEIWVTPMPAASVYWPKLRM